MLLVFLSISVVLCSLRYETQRDADQLDREISELQAEINKNYEYTENLKPLKGAFGLGSTNPNECTNGKPASSLSNKDYLNEFNKGPCTPLIVLAGITATKLQLKIDCKTLRENHPDIFSTCRWTRCDSSIQGTTSSIPKQEYTIWVPDIISPFSLTNPSKDSSTCLVMLFGMEVDPASESLSFKQIKGVQIVPMGMTESSASKSRCGFEAISNMLPITSFLIPTKYKCMEKLRTTLEVIGYRTGLTVQPLPYDWRKSFLNNEVSQKLEKMLDIMYDITGKRVSIYSHSFGNLNVLHVLNGMSQEKKDKVVQRWFSLGAPFLGSPTTFSILIGGDNRFSIQSLGITFWIMKNTVANFPSTFDLMPRNTWDMYQHEVWMKSVKNRISVEKGFKPVYDIPEGDDIVSKIYPNADVDCFGDDWSSRSKKCLTGMEEFNSFGSINGEEITLSSIRKILDKYSYNKDAAKLFDGYAPRSEYDKMVNPGVETVVLYSNINKSPHSVFWTTNPRIFTKNENSAFLPPNSMDEKMGDTSVLSSSNLVPAFKWAYEHLKNEKGAKPIIFAEICSHYNQKISVSSVDSYQGVACQCTKGKESGCDHLGMIVDEGVVDYVANSLKDRQVPNTSSRYFDGMTEDTVRSFVGRCGIINDDSF